jgi:hypothetical protein
VGLKAYKPIFGQKDYIFIYRNDNLNLLTAKHKGALNKISLKHLVEVRVASSMATIDILLQLELLINVSFG